MLGRPIQFFCFAWNSFGSSFWEPKLGPVLGLGIDNCLRLLQIQGRRVGQKMVPKLVTKKCPRSEVSVHAWCVSRHSKNTAYVHVRSTLSCSPSIAERNVRASVSAACNLNVVREYANALGAGARVDCMAAYTSPGCDQPWVPYRVASKSLPAWHHKTRPQDQMKFQFVGGAADVRSCAGSAQRWRNHARSLA